MIIQRPKHLGVFFGGNLGLLNYEILSIQNFKREELNRDAELMRQKWFDYRSLHHLQATYYFVECYTQAIRSHYARTINRDTAPYLRLCKDVDFVNSKERRSIYRLRQLADTMCVPYDFFLNFALKTHYKMIGEKGEWYMPRPSHLVSNEKLIENVMLAWEELCAAAIQFSKDPYYRVQNWTGSQTQRDHEAWVIKQIKDRKQPHFSLCAALYKNGVVRFEEAVRQFDQATISGAMQEFDFA